MNRNKIVKKTREWATILCCDGIDLRLVFKKFSKEENKHDGDFETVAYVESNPRYMESTIYFNTDRLHLVDVEGIVHELLHIKLAEYSGYLYTNTTEAQADKWKGYFEERFVSQMAKILTRKMR